MPVDYTPQLLEIVKAMSRPATPTWMIAIFSAALGFIASVVSQLLQQYYAERKAERRMRLILYSELGSIYKVLVEVSRMSSRFSAQEAFERQQAVLSNRFAQLDGEKYMKDHPDVFCQLKERSVIRDLYTGATSLVGPEGYLGFEIDSGLIIEIFEDMVRLAELPRKHVECYMNPADLVAIDNANEERLQIGQASKPRSKRKK